MKAQVVPIVLLFLIVLWRETPAASRLPIIMLITFSYSYALMHFRGLQHSPINTNDRPFRDLIGH